MVGKLQRIDALPVSRPVPQSRLAIALSFLVLIFQMGKHRALFDAAERSAADKQSVAGSGRQFRL
jgi:hypothetical protein